MVSKFLDAKESEVTPAQHFTACAGRGVRRSDVGRRWQSNRSLGVACVGRLLDIATPYSGAAIFRLETARSVLLLLASFARIAECTFGLGPFHRFNEETRPSGCGHGCLPTTNIRLTTQSWSSQEMFLNNRK